MKNFVKAGLLISVCALGSVTVATADNPPIEPLSVSCSVNFQQASQWNGFKVTVYAVTYLSADGSGKPSGIISLGNNVSPPPKKVGNSPFYQVTTTPFTATAGGSYVIVAQTDSYGAYCTNVNQVGSGGMNQLPGFTEQPADGGWNSSGCPSVN